MPSEAPPIAKTSSPGAGRVPPLAEVALRALRTKILCCELRPGERVTEAQLSADMGFGLTPTREALARLSAERLVITLPRKGYVVTPVTPRYVRELFELWRPVCATLAELAAATATDAEIVGLSSVLDFLGWPRHDPGLKIACFVESWIKLFAGFGAAARNERLYVLFGQLTDEVRRLLLLARDSPCVAEIRIPDRATLRAALGARDAPALRDTVLAAADTIHLLISDRLAADRLA